ncbi:protein disulfide-isomerase TMX3-like protein, partial [Dinothrombium tinctorium]
MPTFMQVAQLVHNEDIGVLVGQVDCTRFTGVATHFNIKGFPTILFISSNKVVEYHGDRNKEDIVDFALRLSGPPIKPISRCDDIEGNLARHHIYFASIGMDPVWSNFSDAAEAYIATSWFYQIPFQCPDYENGIYAIKSSIVATKKNVKFPNGTGISLNEWIKQQRFPQFVKLTPGNFNLLFNSGKILAIALVEEYRIVNRLVSIRDMEFRDLMEAIAHTYDSEERIIFAWTSHLDMINSIAMQTISPLPNLIFINSITLEYYLMDDELIAQNIIDLLNKIKTNFTAIRFRGGDSIHHRAMRMVYEGFTTLMMMYKGNPILTLLVFGLPLSFLAVIVYTSCFSEMTEANEEDEIE